MEPFYIEIRAVHIGSALISGALFLLRGLALNLFGAQWPLAAPLRYVAWAIDTVLLTAALMLMTITHQVPGADAWLTVKVLLVATYVVLGYYALRAPTRERRWASLVGATLVFGCIYSVARAHHPLGMLA
jgi:uncharacterized membrane protein SirB2